MRQYGVVPVGRLDAVRERYFAISVERRLKHPAVVAISEAANEMLAKRARSSRPATGGLGSWDEGGVGTCRARGAALDWAHDSWLTSLLALAAAVLVVPGMGRPAPLLAQAPALTVPYTQFTLPNGLNVILHRDTSVPVVAVNLWYHVGSANERAGRTGFAHLFEHVMFEGSMHVPEGVVRHVARGRGRQQQRLDQHRPHQLLHRPAGQRARARAVPRVGSHGLPARRQGAGQGRRPARRRQERETPERRQPAVRPGVRRAVVAALPAGASV